MDLSLPNLRLIGLPTLQHGLERLDAIFYSKAEPLSTLTAKIIAALHRKNIGFKYGKQPIRLPKSPSESYQVLSDTTSLTSFLADHIEFYNPDKDSYELPSTRNLNVIMKSERFLAGLQEIKAFTDVAGFDQNFNRQVINRIAAFTLPTQHRLILFLKPRHWISC